MNVWPPSTSPRTTTRRPTRCSGSCSATSPADATPSGRVEGGWRVSRGRPRGRRRGVRGRGGARPAADNRPAWLYWSAAHANRLNNPRRPTRATGSCGRLSEFHYGRLSSKLLASRGEPVVFGRVTASPAATLSAVVATDDIIRSLITAQMYRDALREVQYAQRVGGDSPRSSHFGVDSPPAGAGTVADERFAALRGAITTMLARIRSSWRPRRGAARRRPAHHLPARLLAAHYQVATHHHLDPYLIAALMAQESTFNRRNPLARERLRADADHSGYGAPLRTQDGIKPFNTAMRRQPETRPNRHAYFRTSSTARRRAFRPASYNAGDRASIGGPRTIRACRRRVHRRHRSPKRRPT